jgi:hypothetical protein
LDHLSGVEEMLRKEWDAGSRSVLAHTPGLNSSYRLPLWILLYWKEVHSEAGIKQQWEESLGFVQEAVMNLGTDMEKGSWIANEMLRAYDSLSARGWNQPVFPSGHHWDFDTINMIKLLVDSPDDRRSWTTHGQMHCGLLSLRARYADKFATCRLVHSEFQQAVERTFDPKRKTDHDQLQSLMLAAAWLRQDLRRCIAAVMHVGNNHWAAIQIFGDGRVIVADSLSPGTLPTWWKDNRSFWAGFIRLLAKGAVMKDIPGDYGRQSDGYNCGPAALTAIRCFLDEDSSTLGRRSGKCVTGTDGYGYSDVGGGVSYLLCAYIPLLIRRISTFSLSPSFSAPNPTCIRPFHHARRLPLRQRIDQQLCLPTQHCTISARRQKSSPIDSSLSGNGVRN